MHTASGCHLFTAQCHTITPVSDHKRTTGPGQVALFHFHIAFETDNLT